MNADRKSYDDISQRIIGCAFTVANTLGAGFLEKIYENALAHEMRKASLLVTQQIAIRVEYDGVNERKLLDNGAALYQDPVSGGIGHRS